MASESLSPYYCSRAAQSLISSVVLKFMDDLGPTKERLAVWKELSAVGDPTLMTHAVQTAVENRVTCAAKNEHETTDMVK